MGSGAESKVFARNIDVTIGGVKISPVCAVTVYSVCSVIDPFDREILSFVIHSKEWWPYLGISWTKSFRWSQSWLPLTERSKKIFIEVEV